MPIPQHCHNNDGCFYTNCKRCKLEHAAPDLLAACELLYKRMAEDEPLSTDLTYMRMAAAAIAKAKGD